MKFNRLTLFLFVALSLTSCKLREVNGILDDGIYEVRFDPYLDGSSVYDDYKLIVKGAGYRKEFKSGQSEKGKIEKIFTDKFVLTDSNKRELPLDSLSDLQKSIRHWEPECFELAGKNGDTLRFRTTFTGQLHVSLNTGVMIR